jgi:hypothetical protein
MNERHQVTNTTVSMQQLTTPFTSWLHKIHVHIRLQQRGSDLKRLLILLGGKKKNSITIRKQSGMQHKKITEA